MWGQVFVQDKANLRPIHKNSQDQFDVNDEGYVVAVGTGNTWKDGIAKNLWGTNVIIDGRSYAWGIPFLQVDSVTGINVLRQIGDGNPAFHYGWGNTLRYRNYRVFVQTTGQIGGDVYAKSMQDYYASGDWKDVDQFGKADETKKPVTYYSAMANATVYNQPFVKPGGYLNVQEALIGYTYTPHGSRIFDRMGFRRVQIDLIGRNLMTFTRYPGLNVMAGSPTRREDTATYPLTRTFTGAFTFTF
jgi:hypothetical protein